MRESVQLLTPVNAGPALARLRPRKSIDGFAARVFMLGRVKATVEGVRQAEELADIGRAHRTGAVISALMEELEYVLTIESKPTKEEPGRTAIIR